MVGKKFSYLKVVRKAGTDKWGALLWDCKCSCGAIITTRGASLRSGNTKSCGVCSHLKSDYIGIQFNFLNVIDRVVKKSNSGRNQYYLTCRCVCGQIVDILQSSVINNHTMSCGCKKSELQRVKKLGINNHNFIHGKWKDRQYKNAMIRNYYARKRQNGGTHTGEDVENILIKQKHKCFYCKTTLQAYHIDHKIPVSRGGGNNKDNLCCACPACNLKKHDKTDAEFMAVIRS